MKWIKNFCLEISCKVKDNIITVIATAIVSIFLLIISFVFKTYLATAYTFTFPLWGWVLVIAATAAVAVLIFAAITTRRRCLARSHLLDGTNDICMALVRWITDRCKETLAPGGITIITVKYDDVDKECGLAAGTAKDYLLPGVKFLIESGFPVTAGLPGEKTITITFGKNTEIYKDSELPKDIPATQQVRAIYASRYTAPLRIVEGRFMQALISSLELQHKDKGVVLTVNMASDALAIWSREGKQLLHESIINNQVELVNDYRDILNKFLVHHQGDSNHLIIPRSQDVGKIFFRYASGGTLPIVKYKNDKFYCLIYREINPIGWNIANGGCDRCDELLHPEKTILRELNEELIIIDKAQNHRYVLGETCEYPEFILARDVLKAKHGINWENLTLHKPKDFSWEPGPDKLMVQIGMQAQETLDNCFININAEDLGIEIDRVAKFTISDTAMLFDGELCDMPGGAQTCINAPIGLFKVLTMNTLLKSDRWKYVQYEPDYIFWNGIEQKAIENSPRAVVQNMYWPSISQKLNHNEKEEFQTKVDNNTIFELCPVTSTILRRYIGV